MPNRDSFVPVNSYSDILRIPSGTSAGIDIKRARPSRGSPRGFNFADYSRN